MTHISLSFAALENILADPYQDPTMVTQVYQLSCPASGYSDDYASVSHGKWLIFRNCEDYNETWRVIREEVRSGNLGATGVFCTTKRYDPSSSGGGPDTSGVMCVCAKEEDHIDVGMRLVKLKAIQHDIKYKTFEKSTNWEFVHIPGINHRVTSLTIFWNNGDPYASEEPRPETVLCPAPCRRKFEYNVEADIWKVHIVRGTPKYESERIHGKWIIDCVYQKMEATRLWHKLKHLVERGDIPAISMEFPRPPRNVDPAILVFTAEGRMGLAGEKIISIVKRDICYMVGGGFFSDDKKKLYWNEGKPSYENLEHNPGIAGNWREH